MLKRVYDFLLLPTLMAFIEQWQSKIAFPYGVKYKGAQVVYADLAVEFFEK